MPDIWDLDENAIRTDEYKATATLALLALRRGQMPPLGTPLQRTTTRIAAPIWADHQHRQIRAALAAMRSRAVK